MLALLKSAAVQLLVSNNNVTAAEVDDCFAWDGHSTITLNVDDIRCVLPTLPAVSWHGVADVCTRAASPVYQTVRKAFSEDVDEFAQLVADLDPLSLDNYEVEDQESVCATAADESLHNFGLSTPPQPVRLQCDALPRTTRHRRKPNPDLDKVLVIRNPDSSIPTIVVTPCPTLPRDRTCLVPYQDVSFGNRLAVPMHPVVNGAFPPLVPKALPHVDHWCFKEGHWWAVLPSLEEQMKRNMSSRPFSRRRRPSDAWARQLRTRQPAHSLASPRLT